MTHGLSDSLAAAGRDPFEQELERGGRYRELADLLEAALLGDPPLLGPKAESTRLRLVALYKEQLRDPARAVAHLEALLTGETLDAAAVRTAEELLEQRSVAGRVATLLSDAYARLGRTNDEIAMLTRELRLARPPRLAQVQGRLATLRQDVLGDVAGAMELLEQQMMRDPGNDESRRRFIGNSIALSRSKEAAHLLSRAVRGASEQAQARVGLDIGLLHLRDGDRDRARRAFAQVVEGDGDPTARLAAARQLLEQRATLAPQAVVRPLSIVAEHDPDPEVRKGAANELLEQRSRVRLDARSEIAAWRALVDSPRADEALARLEVLYDASGDRMNVSDVLERRSARESDPSVAQALALRSAELCSTNASEPEQGIAAWRRYIARYGSSRQAHARLIPLLERSKNFAELADVLSDELELVPELQRGTVLARLGELRLRHLSDPEAALELFRRSVELAPRESRSRGCLEEMLADREWGLRAADILEPLYRGELSGSERARRQLARVLALRAERAPHTDERLRACSELGEMLESEGQSAEALVWYERAWSLDPRRTELLARLDALAARAGQSAEQRLERYAAAVDRVEEADRRAELLYAIGALQHSQGDVSTAVTTWRRALETQPGHFPTHEALLRAHQDAGDSADVMSELTRALDHIEGKDRQITLVRIGELHAARGAPKEALELCRPLLDEPNLDETVLAALERFAEEGEDVQTARLVFERRVSQAQLPEDRARALARLGQFLDEWQGDTAGAARSWKAAAEQYLTLPGQAGEALRLLERALDQTREDVEPAARLLELYLEAGEWARVPEVYGLLLRRSEQPAACIELLLSLESSAILAGAATEFSELVEHALWRISEQTSPWRRPLIAARARVFASAGRRDEAAEVYRTLLESYADENDARDFQKLIDSSPAGDWRRDNVRWLFGWRTDRAEDPVPLLVDWAIVEETEFGDREAAIALWERAAVRDPSRIQIWEALVRLKIAKGDVEGGLDALQPLRALLNDERKLAVELGMASTLIERLDRAERALPILGAVLERAPADSVARELAYRVLRSDSPLRARAGELLEQAGAAIDSAEEQRGLLEQLLEITSDARGTTSTQLAKARRRWFERLLELTEGEESFSVAKRAAFEFSGDETVWRKVELLSCQLEDPHRAVHVYAEVLGGSLAPEIAELLGRRLVAFADERADRPQGVTAALERVLELSPGARWALDRVKLAMTAERRWPSLFSLYERAADAASEPTERADLLDEAAIAARDVAGDHDRAIEYWERVFQLRNGDTRVDLSLERLYERRGHTEKLIAHLGRRAGSLSGVALRSLRERMASLWLDLSNGKAALAVIEALLADDAVDDATYKLLERVIALPPPPATSADGVEAHRQTMQVAAAQLKQRYSKLGRSAEVARVLEAELALFTSPADRAPRLKELFELRYVLGDRSGAFECLGELVVLEPEGRAHRERLGKLANELGAQGRLAEVLIAAADRARDPQVSVTLLQEAAGVQLERLSDASAAADLYVRILSGPYERSAHAEAARALHALVGSMAKAEQRCGVLERLASFETDTETNRRTALEAARVAFEELGDPMRAVRNLRPLVQKLPADRQVLDRLVDALRAAENYGELADALAARAAISEGSDAYRDLTELARICAERLSEPYRAIDVWREVRERFGRDTESFEALARLLEGRGNWPELASLLTDEAKVATTKEPLYARLADIYRDHIGDDAAAVEAYIAAGEPIKAVRLLESAEKVVSKDAALCVKVAVALKAAGQLDQAEQLLRRQLEQDGRRRAKERGNVYLELAQVQHAAGRFDDAVKELSTAAELYPTDPAILAALGRVTLERGDLERAEQSYRALLLMLRHSSEESHGGPSRAEVYVELGEVALQRGDSDRARDLVASAFEAGLESEDEGLGLEQALRRRAKLELLERAIETRFSYAANPAAAARALASLVQFYVERDAMDAARTTQMAERADRVRRELGARPADGAELDALQKLVGVYRSLGRAEQAIELLDVMSTTAASVEELARFELEAARLLVDVPFRGDEAVRRLQALLQRKVAQEDVSVLLSRVLEEAGRIDEALAVYQSLSRQPGREIEALRAIVRLEEARGTGPAALADALERLLGFEQGSGRAAVAQRLSALRKENKDFVSMERALALGFAADPSHAELRDELVGLYVSRGEWARGAATLERALQASTEDTSLRWRLSELYQKAGDTEAALRAIDFVPPSRSDKAQLGRRRFIVLEAAGRYEEALSELEAAYHIESRHGAELLAAINRTNMRLASERWAVLAADLFVRHGDAAKAHETLQEWLARSPDSRPALRRLGKLAAKEHDLGTAIDAYRRLAQLESGEARKSAALELAKLCDAAGRPGDALTDLEGALQDAPKNPELRDRVRKLYAQAGARLKEARMLLEQSALQSDSAARVELLLEAAELLTKENAWAEALAALEQARSIDPERAKAVLLLARVLAAQGERTRAIETLTKFAATQSARKSKHLDQVYREVAEMHLAQDELIEAFDSLSQAHRLNKGDGQVAFLLGLVAIDLDQLEVAGAALRSFVATRGHVVDSGMADEPTPVSRAYFHLAFIEHVRGDEGAARRMASRALEESRNNRDAQQLLEQLRPS
ncbi:MAG TPA: tetratricopeptide repeat protein [Polyangiaceae bacterium]